MLKNQKEREDYLENDENWETMEEFSMFRFQRHKDKRIPLWRLQVYMPERKASSFVMRKEGWYPYMYGHQWILVSKDGFDRNITKTEAIALIKNI